jgi:hypothetical protein
MFIKFFKTLRETTQISGVFNAISTSRERLSDSGNGEESGSPLPAPPGGFDTFPLNGRFPDPLWNGVHTLPGEKGFPDSVEPLSEFIDILPHRQASIRESTVDIPQAFNGRCGREEEVHFNSGS